MISHVKTIHEGVKFRCPECEYECNRSVNLENHVKAIHEGVSYNCKLCLFKSSWRNKAREHVKKIHGQNIDFNMPDFITEMYTKRELTAINYKAGGVNIINQFPQENDAQHLDVKQEMDICDDIKDIDVNIDNAIHDNASIDYA